ncbi:hypothetical protein N7470_005895 [Penicillium chermesinum]|nr:hypothetical protein N7470_005895 [Penicillium chermesinum]
MIPSGDSDQRVQNLERIVRHFLGDIPLDEESVGRIAAKCRVEDDELEASLDVNESFDVQFISGNVAFYSGRVLALEFLGEVATEYALRSNRNGPNCETILASDPSPIPRPNRHRGNGPSSPRPIAEFLIHVFFKYVEVNTFYLERRWIENKLRLCYNPATEFTASDIPWVCSFFAVLAIGTQVAHMEESQARPDPTSPASEEITVCSEDSVGLDFYRMASRLVPDVILAASYESVQAFLLLAIYGLPVSTGGLSYTYFGLAMKMAIQNGMHRKYAGTDCDPRTVELRNRLFWTVYSLERRISIMHGRPTSLSRSEINADLPTDCPTFESPNFANAIAFIELVMWTGEVAETLNQFKKCPKRLLLEYSERLLQLKSNIQSWWNSVPIDLEDLEKKPDQPLFRQKVHLKLCYLSIYIYMGRPFIFKENNQATHSGEGQNAGKEHRSELVQDCVKSALGTLDLLQSLSNHVGLCRASYTEFSSCRAAILVILAECLNSGNSPELQGGLDRGMVLIRQMIGGTASESEISYIESIEAAIRELSSNENPASAESSAESCSSATAYAKFKDWTQSMKKDKNAMHTTELSSFSPVSHLTARTDNTFPDLADIFEHDWPANELGLAPELFLDSTT